MGFIAKLKEFFNKNIECGEEIDKHIVFPFVKKKYIYINKNILVRDNTACVIVYRYKVCDILMPGKYKITEDNLPVTFARAKIKKLNKKGAKVRRIRVDVYFVNTQEINNFEFISDSPFSVKAQDIGRVIGYLQGRCNLRVIDPERLMKALIAETGKAKLKEIPSDIGLWIGNKINKTIEKQKINTDVILTQQEYAQNLLNTCLEDGYDKIGLFVKNIKLKAVDFPKRYQKKVNAYMARNAKPIRRYDFNSMLIGKVANRSVSISNNTSQDYIGVSRSSTMQNSNKHGDFKQIKSCSQCGKSYDGDTKFCRNCGKEL